MSGWSHFVKVEWRRSISCCLCALSKVRSIILFTFMNIWRYKVAILLITFLDLLLCHFMRSLVQNLLYLEFEWTLEPLSAFYGFWTMVLVRKMAWMTYFGVHAFGAFIKNLHLEMLTYGDNLIDKFVKCIHQDLC